MTRLPLATSYALALFLLLHATVATCQDQTANPSLAAQVIDPTAPIKTYTLQDRFAPSMWGLDDRQNEVTFMAAVPHHMLTCPTSFGLRCLT